MVYPYILYPLSAIPSCVTELSGLLCVLTQHFISLKKGNQTSPQPHPQIQAPEAQGKQELQRW